MSKVKEKLKTIIDFFPVSIITVILLTLFVTITINSTNKYINIISSYVIIFSVIFSISTYTIEALIRKNVSKKKVLLYGIAIIISSIFTLLVKAENVMVHEYATRILITYCLSLIFFDVYALYRKSGIEFNEYVAKAMTNIVKSVIIYSVLAIGGAIVLSIYCLLIINGGYLDIIVRAEILLLGLYFIPKLMLSLIETKDEIGRFFEIIFKYVLDILLIIAFAVIYIYIAKIIILRNMPSNMVYRIITILFIVGIPIWTIASHFDDKKILGKINKSLPIAFIPFILLQIYTLGLRIANNGLTEVRYLGIMIIIFEIIYTVIYIIKREKICKCAFVLIGMAIVTFIVPAVNIYNAPIIWQYNILNNYDANYEYTQKELERFKGAYNFLRVKTNGNKIIEKVLTEEEKNKLLKGNINEYDVSYGKQVINYESPNEPLNIAGYNKMYHFNVYNYNTLPLNIAFSNIECQKINKYLDLTEFMTDTIKNSPDPNTKLKHAGTIKIDETTGIIISHANVIYNKNKDEVTQYSITGYILEK